jgi:hypothetical protein
MIVWCVSCTVQISDAYFQPKYVLKLWREAIKDPCVYLINSPWHFSCISLYVIIWAVQSYFTWTSRHAHLCACSITDKMSQWRLYFNLSNTFQNFISIRTEKYVSAVTKQEHSISADYYAWWLWLFFDRLWWNICQEDLSQMLWRKRVWMKVK